MLLLLLIIIILTRSQTRALSNAAATGHLYLPDDQHHTGQISGLDHHNRDITSPVSDISDFSDLGTASTVDMADLQEDLVRRTIVLSDGEMD